MATAMAEVIEALSLRYGSEGADKVVADANKVAAAQDRAAGSANKLAAATEGVTVAEEKSTRVHQSVETRLNRVQREYDAAWRAQTKRAAAERDLMAAQMQGLITEQRRLELMGLIAQRHHIAATAIDRETAAINRQNVALAANDNAGRARRQVLGYQLFDIGQGAMLGAPLAMVAAQQGPQIAQLYASQGGLNRLWKDATTILGGLVRAAGPWIAAAGAIYGAYRLISSYGVEASMAIDDATRALAEQAAPIGSVRGMINDLASTQKTYTDAISATGRAQDATTAIVVASSEREYNAKRQLLEIELKRQNAAIAVQEAEIRLEQFRMAKEVRSQVTQRPDLVARGFEDPRIGRFVNLPDEITGLSRINEVMAPFLERINEMRARLDLAKISTEQLEAALGIAFDGGTSGAARAKAAVDAATASVNRLNAALGEMAGIAAPTMSDAARAAAAFDKAMAETTGMEERLGVMREYERTLKRIRENALDELARKEREVAIAGMDARDAAAARIRDQYATLTAGLREMGLSETVVARATSLMNTELAQSAAHFDAIDEKARAGGLKQFEKDATQAADTINGLFADVGQTLAGIFSKPIDDVWDLVDNVVAAVGQIGQRLMSLEKFDWAKALGLSVPRSVPANYVGPSPSLPAGGAMAASGLQGYAAPVARADARNHVAVQAWNFFQGKGLASHQIAGIMGNIRAESNFNPSAIGDAGAAHGLFQHHSNRRNGSFALGDAQSQLDLAWRELQTSENTTLKALRAATNVTEATAAFIGFERPAGWSPNNPMGGHNWSGRLDFANQAMAQYGNIAANQNVAAVAPIAVSPVAIDAGAPGMSAGVSSTWSKAAGIAGSACAGMAAGYNSEEIAA